MYIHQGYRPFPFFFWQCNGQVKHWKTTVWRWDMTPKQIMARKKQGKLAQASQGCLQENPPIRQLKLRRHPLGPIIGLDPIELELKFSTHIHYPSPSVFCCCSPFKRIKNPLLFTPIHARTSSLPFKLPKYPHFLEEYSRLPLHTCTFFCTPSNTGCGPINVDQLLSIHKKGPLRFSATICPSNSCSRPPRVRSLQNTFAQKNRQKALAPYYNSLLSFFLAHPKTPVKLS